MSNWKDEVKRGITVASSRKIGAFKLSVHRHIDEHPDTWLASSYGIFERRALSSGKLDEAKCQATAILQVILEDALEDISS